MKRAVTAILCAAMAWAGVAGAVTDVQMGQSTRGVQQLRLVGGIIQADSTGAVLTFETDGSVRSVDTDRDRNKVNLWQSFISSASLAAGNADSNLVPLDVHEYRYLKLLLKVTPIGAAANTTVRLAFQFRECMNGGTDSTSSFPEYIYAEPPKPSQRDSIVFGVVAGQARLVTFAGVDTSFAGHIVTGGVSTPWSGEYVVTFNMNRSAPASGVAAAPYSYPNGVAIPLDSFFGRAARFNKLQVRIRNLNITGPAVKYDLSMLGFAQ